MEEFIGMVGRAALSSSASSRVWQNFFMISSHSSSSSFSFVHLVVGGGYTTSIQSTLRTSSRKSGGFSSSLWGESGLTPNLLLKAVSMSYHPLIETGANCLNQSRAIPSQVRTNSPYYVCCYCFLLNAMQAAEPSELFEQDYSVNILHRRTFGCRWGGKALA